MFIGFVVVVIKSVASFAIDFGLMLMVYSGLYAVMDVVRRVMVYMVIKLAILKMRVTIVSVLLVRTVYMINSNGNGNGNRNGNDMYLCY